MLHYWRKLVRIIGIGIFVAFLVAHAVLGSYSRFMADDYCSAAQANSKGVLGGAIQEYMNWSGRFSANFFDSLMGYIGPPFTPYASAVVIVIWLVVLIGVLRLIMAAPRKRTRFLDTLLLATILLSATLIISPNVAQSLYWGQGMRSVIPPLILGTAFVGLIQYHSEQLPKKSWFWFIIAGSLTFVAGGFSETYVVLQTSILAMITLFGFAFVLDSQNLALDVSIVIRNLLPLLVTGLLCSILSMVVVIVAPGNIIRQAHFPPPPNLLNIVKIAMESMMQFVRSIIFSPIKLLSIPGLVGYSALLGSEMISDDRPNTISRQVILIVLHWLPPITFLLLFACFSPAAYGTSSAPPSRTSIIPTYILVCALAFWGYILGKYAQTRRSFMGIDTRSLQLFKVTALSIFILFTLGTLRATYKAMQLQPRFASYALEWDKVDQLIRQAKTEGYDSITVMPVINIAGLSNKCVSSYYGLEVKTDDALIK